MKKIENHQAKMMEKKIDDYIKEQMAQIQLNLKMQQTQQPRLLQQ